MKKNDPEEPFPTVIRKIKTDVVIKKLFATSIALLLP